MRPILHLFDSLSQKDASALAICLGFHDEGLLLPNELLAQLAVLSWKQPCLGEEVVVLGGSLEHVHQTDAQQVFPSQDVNAWEMTDLLVEVEPDKQVRLDVVVSPQDIPGTVRFHTVHHAPP